MQVILKEDILNLGYKDDIVSVKDGYGRNYLIPQGKAVIASESARKELAENLKQRAHKIAKIKQDGSVTNIQIAEALAKLGHEIDRKIIVVKDAVKEIGSYKAVVKLHKEVNVEIPFEVVAEEAAAE